MLDFASGFWKTKLKREIVKAKTHNRKSKNSKLRERRGEIEIISPFCVSTFSGFRLSLIRVFFFCIFASRKVAEWSRRWTLKSRCRHRCGFDPHVCQGFKAPSLAQGFADFPDWNIGLPPQDWWPCENPISVKRSFISPSENLPLSLPYLHIRVVSSTYD